MWHVRHILSSPAMPFRVMLLLWAMPWEHHADSGFARNGNGQGALPEMTGHRIRSAARRLVVTAVLSLCAMLVLTGCGEDEQKAAQQAAANITSANDSDIGDICLAKLPPATGLSESELAKMDSQKTGTMDFDVWNFSHEFVDGRHRYSHARRFTAGAGIDMTIFRGRVCVSNGAECVDACVNYDVPAGTSLVQATHHVASVLDQDKITLQYWARDSAGNILDVNQTLLTDGTGVRVE